MSMESAGPQAEEIWTNVSLQHLDTVHSYIKLNVIVWISD